jgi:hypothetical protein
MLPETEAQVTAIRAAVKRSKDDLGEAKIRFGQNDDKHLAEQMKFAHFWLDDVELHLSILSEDRFPPRTLAEESNVLVGARAQLETGLAQAKKVVAWSLQYGDKFQAIG